MWKQSGARTLSPTAFLMKRWGEWAETALEKWLVPYWPLVTAWSPTVRLKVRLRKKSCAYFKLTQLLSLTTALSIGLLPTCSPFNWMQFKPHCFDNCIYSCFLLLQPLYQIHVSSLLRNAECSGQISLMLYPGESGTLNLKQWQQEKWELAGPGPTAPRAESLVPMTGLLSLMDLR